MSTLSGIGRQLRLFVVEGTRLMNDEEEDQGKKSVHSRRSSKGDRQAVRYL